MKKLFFMITITLMTISCTHQKVERVPSSNSALDNKIVKVESLLNNLENMRYSKTTEIFVDFIDAGKVAKGKHILRAKVYSNHIEEVESASVYINDNHAWDLKLRREMSEKLIDETVPFHLPLGKTIIKFKLLNGEVREVELECTKLESC